MPATPPPTNPPDPAAPFSADPIVGPHLAALDWAATPLGPPDTWTQSLRTTVRLMLSSRFSMWMGWGDDLTFLCNAAYRRDTLGAKFPWALGRPAREVWAEAWPALAPRIDAMRSTGQATWDEALLLFLERSGFTEETYHTFSYSPLQDDDGTIAGMLCVVSEDTERVVAEQRIQALRNLGSNPSALRSEREAIDFTCEQLAAERRLLPFTLLYLFDDDGQCARLAGTTGLPAGHPAAPPVLRLDPDGARWPVGALAGGATCTVALDGLPGLPTGDWPEPPTHALAVPLTRQGGGVTGFLVAAVNRYRPLDAGYRDFVQLIAGQVAAALANARAHDADRRRADELAALDAAKTAFFTNVSHELRTPLMLLLAPTEDALSDTADALSPRQRHRLELVHRNGRRLLGLVNTLLDFSRLASGQATGRFLPTDLARHTADLAAMFETAALRAGLRLSVDAPPLPEPVYVDHEMWAKIVLNLLSNALKFTFDGGIAVQLRPVDEAVELTVRDTGVGIAPADQAHLFERFRRVATTRSRSHEGSGIGLALVAELAGLHGGTVGVESTPGVGSTFTVRLPLGAGHLPADQVLEGSDRPPDPFASTQVHGIVAEALGWLRDDPLEANPGAAGPLGPPDTAPRLLVVDDNADMRDYLLGVLGGDYRITTASDGLQALQLARSDPPDLVLSDVMMPNLDGFGLLQALRREPATTAVPVIMLSARAGEDGTVEGLEAGADDYLGKPFTARELRARVRANLELDRSRRIRAELERHQALLDQAEHLAGVGSWELDLDTGALIGSDEYFRLTRTSPDRLRRHGLAAALDAVHPDDRPIARACVDAALAGQPLDLELRLAPADRPGDGDGDGGPTIVRARAHLQRDADGRPVRLRGSLQDVTAQRRAERETAAAAAASEAAQREHQIADALQRSLLPREHAAPDHLHVATLYRPGVQGTQVGGDWYDVIPLGAGRTALVIGDVMGRGIAAAAVMGQLRAAARAYARLDLPPSDVIELLDAAVLELGDDQIVTCIYAVFDPSDGSLTYANAGHPPPLLRGPAGSVERLPGASSPPLGVGIAGQGEARVELPVDAVLALYTDGLVEHRGLDLDDGIDAFTRQLAAATGPLEGRLPQVLDALWPDGPDDDVALLLAHVGGAPGGGTTARHAVVAGARAVARARELVADVLRAWQLPEERLAEVVLLASELVTNALLHGQPPVELRLRHGVGEVVLEVEDHATYLPRRLRPTLEDEHGRGLQIVAALSRQWGTRPTAHGKVVWCVLTTASDEARRAAPRPPAATLRRR